METKLEYLLDSGNTLRLRNIGTKYLKKRSICIGKYIGPTLHCSIGNDIFRFVSASKFAYFLFDHAYFCL